MFVSAISLMESKQEVGDYNFLSITAGNEIEVTANPGEVRDCKRVCVWVCVCVCLWLRGCVCGVVCACVTFGMVCLELN